MYFQSFNFCRSEEWKYLSAKDRDKMGITFEREGEFWYVEKTKLVSFLKIAF